MLALYLAVLAAAWLIEAQDNNTSYHVHGSVAFVRTGERTPTIAGGAELTALGAQQMYQLGQNLRGRYITTSRAMTEMGVQQITPPVLSADFLDNNQIYIQTTDDAYLVASAQALMQGLYPPYSLASIENLLANGTTVNAPLGGYQYPLVNAASDMDPMSVYVAGVENCPASETESLMYFTTQDYLNTNSESQSVYGSLDASMFDGYYTQDQIDYINAIDVYDYLSYATVHNSTLSNMFQNHSEFAGVYDKMRYYANEQAWFFWGNTSASTTDGNLRAMAGKTLAALILGQLQKVVMNGTAMSNGQAVTDVEWHPLSLLFGEEAAFVSLFALMELDFLNGDYFRAIPPVGSAMIFELFSRGSENDTSFPTDTNHLYVNFRFQNGTNYKGDIQSYPLFGQGPDGTDMLWEDFNTMMSRIMTNTLTDYCTQCNSGALFCSGVEGTTVNITMSSNGKSGGMSPQVAGVIGAAVTLGVALILFAIGLLVGGIRFHPVSRSKKSELGGFKGSNKLASDQDLSLPKNGVAPAGIVSFGASDEAGKPKERVGSWELRQKEFGKDIGDESRRGSFEAIEAAMSRPVEPTERV